MQIFIFFNFENEGKLFVLAIFKIEAKYCMVNCPLCLSSKLQHLEVLNDKRSYFLCSLCMLISVHPQYHLSESEAKKHYLNHNNTIEQEGYVQFLMQVIGPSLEFIEAGMVGLDYGCGPSPVLSRILETKGVACHNYDPVFDIGHPLEKYDFIFSTECFEHFLMPSADIRQIITLLKPEGFLSIMSHQWQTVAQFKNWYYKIDPTHVSFYHEKTFEYLAEFYNLKIRYKKGDRVVILQKADEWHL